MGRPAFLILSENQSQLVACSGKSPAEMSDQMDGDFCSTLHPILYPGYKVNFKLDTALTKSGVGNSSSFKTSVYCRVF